MALLLYMQLMLLSLVYFFFSVKIQNALVDKNI